MTGRSSELPTVTVRRCFASASTDVARPIRGRRDSGRGYVPCRHCAQLGCDREVVGDEGVAFVLGLEASLDEIRASLACRGTVGDANHAVDAPAVQDAFAGRDAVAHQLGAFADGRGLAGGDGHAMGRWRLLAVVRPGCGGAAPGDFIVAHARGAAAADRIWSAMTLCSMRRSMRLLGVADVRRAISALASAIVWGSEGLAGAMREALR